MAKMAAVFLLLRNRAGRSFKGDYLLLMVSPLVLIPPGVVLIVHLFDLFVQFLVRLAPCPSRPGQSAFVGFVWKLKM
jgi:hypothetical protein